MICSSAQFQPCIFLYALYLIIRYIASRKTKFHVSLSGTFTEGNSQEEPCLQGDGAGVLAEKDGTLTRVAMGKDLVGDAACHHLDPWSDSPSSGGRCPGEAAKLYPKRSLLLLHRDFFSSPFPPAPVLFVKYRFLGAELLVGFRGAGCQRAPPPQKDFSSKGSSLGPCGVAVTTYSRSGLGPVGSTTWSPCRAPRCPCHPPTPRKVAAGKSRKNWAEQDRKGGPPLLPVVSVIKKQTKHKELAKHQGHANTKPMQNLHRARTLSQNLDSAQAHS